MSAVFYDDGSVPASRDTDDEQDDQLDDDLTITQNDDEE